MRQTAISKAFKNFSIKWKLLTIILAVTAFGMFLAVLGLAFGVKNLLQKASEDNLNILAQVFGQNVRAALVFKDSSEASESLAALSANEHIITAGVYDADGQLFVSYFRDGQSYSLPDRPIEPGSHEVKGDFFDHTQPIVVQNDRIGTIYLRSDSLGVDSYLAHFISVAVVLSLAILFFLFVPSTKLQKLITDPVVKLADTAKAVSQNRNYTIRATKYNDDELGVLVDAFNDMLTTIQTGELDRERYLNAIKEKNNELQQVVYVTSHDLRAPLVNIQGFSRELTESYKELTAQLSNGQVPAQVQEGLTVVLQEDIPEALQIISASTNKMDSLLKGLLKLSRFGRAALTIQKLDMNALISEVVKTFEFQLKELGVHVVLESFPPCYGDTTQINQVFSNLIGNALKYLHPERNGEIRLYGEEKEHESVYCVQDNGVGIPDGHQRKIFEIFHRLDPEASEGEGLGLTIVLKIIDRHGGRVWLESEPGLGSKFFVCLPAESFQPITV